MFDLPFTQEEVEGWSEKVAETLDEIGDSNVLDLVTTISTGEVDVLLEDDQICSLLMTCSQLTMLTWLLREHWQFPLDKS